MRVNTHAQLPVSRMRMAARSSAWGHGDLLYVPVRLKTGVDEAAVIDDWRSHGITPLWCKCRLPEGLARLLEARFDGAQVEEGTGGRLDLCIPIRLAAGVERDRVLDGRCAGSRTS